MDSLFGGLDLHLVVFSFFFLYLNAHSLISREQAYIFSYFWYLSRMKIKKFGTICAVKQETKNQARLGIEKFFITLIAMVVVFGSLFFAWPEFQRHRALSRHDAELTRRIEEKKREISRLRDYQNRFKTDSEFVEMIARQNRRVFPGELVFIFEDPK